MTRVFKLKHIVLLFSAVAMTVILSLSVHFTGAYAVYYNRTPRKLPIYSVERDDKAISISFDCAWGTEYTDEILTALKAADVRATFFMVEFWTEKYADYVKKIDENGHEIGTHSSTHSYMSKQSASEIKNELTTSSQAIEEITGKKVELFRPPYGDYDDELILSCEEMGIYPIQWDTDSLDWKDLSASEILSRVTGKVNSGSIILMHNNGLHTAESLPLILSTLKNRGYKFVPIGELIFREDYTLDATGRQVKNSVS